MITFSNGQTQLLFVNRDSSKVTSNSTFQGSGYPNLSMDDILSALQVPLLDPKFNKSIAARGVNLSDLVYISPSSGWFGPDEEGRGS